MTLPDIPMDEVIEFLVGLLNTPSPTGDTEQAMAYAEQAVHDLPLTISRTVKGGLVLTWPGDATHPHALTAHTDTLGAMVRKIKSSGRLELTSVGGFDWHSVEGESCTVATTAGQIVGVLPPGGSSTGNNFGFQLQAELGISDGRFTEVGRALGSDGAADVAGLDGEPEHADLPVPGRVDDAVLRGREGRRWGHARTSGPVRQ